MTIDGTVKFTYGYLGGTNLLNSTIVTYLGTQTYNSSTDYNSYNQVEEITSTVTTTSGSATSYDAGYDYYSNGQRHDESVGTLESDNATTDTRGLTFAYDGQQQLTSVTNTSDSPSVFSAEYDDSATASTIQPGRRQLNQRVCESVLQRPRRPDRRRYAKLHLGCERSPDQRDPRCSERLFRPGVLSL